MININDEPDDLEAEEPLCRPIGISKVKKIAFGPRSKKEYKETQLGNKKRTILNFLKMKTENYKEMTYRPNNIFLR